MASFRTIVKTAHDYYFNEWRGNEKVCPAFGKKIYVTNLGWNHVVNKQRPLVDLIIRLKKIKLARELLENASTYQTLQKKGKYYLYGLSSIKGETRIKVVVSSKNKKGKKVVYSWMFKNVKRAKQKRIDRHNKKIISEFRRKHPERRHKRK